MPTTTGRATDYITFTRTSNATVTDSNGVIKWAGHNLLTNSESFDASAWTKASVTVSANSTSAPNGTTTADKIISTSGTGEQRVYTASSVIPSTVGIRYTFSVFAKADGANWLVIRDALSGFGDTSFDLVNGAVGTVASGRTATITSLGNGFYLCSVSNTVTASYVVGDISYCLADADNGRATFVGNGTKALILWGAHLYRSDLGGMVLNPARGDAYYPTTPRNLLGFTEDFSNAAWVKASSTVIADSLSAPSGLNTADTLTASSGTVFPQVLQATPAYATAQMVSVYAKAGTYGILQLFNAYGAAHYANFNLSAGVVGTKGGSVSDSGMVPLGNGWYRCWAYFAALDDVGIGMAGSTSATKQATWAATGSETVYLWGAQLSDSASLDAYSPVYGAAVTSAAYYAPRLDYDANGSALGLLVEEQRTNLLLRSSEFDNVVWGKNNLTVTANTIAAPDGSTSGDTLLATAGTAATFVVQTTLLSAVAHAVSFVAKAGTHSFIQILNSGDNQAFANFNLSTGASGTTGSKTTASITNLGNGWYRCTAVFDATVTFSNSHRLYMVPASTSAFAAGLTAAGTETVYLYSAQLEAGSFATSYIPTGASTATRTADVASVSTQAFPYSATEGTLVAKGTFIAPADAGVSVMANLDNGSSGESINIYRQSNLVYLNIFDNSGPAQAQWAVSGTTNLSTAAVAYKLNDIGAAVNGSSQTPDTSATLPTVDRMNIGRMWGGTFGANGWICQITYIPRRLSSSELQARTV